MGFDWGKFGNIATGVNAFTKSFQSGYDAAQGAKALDVNPVLGFLGSALPGPWREKWKIAGKTDKIMSAAKGTFEDARHLMRGSPDKDGNVQDISPASFKAGMDKYREGLEIMQQQGASQELMAFNLQNYGGREIGMGLQIRANPIWEKFYSAEKEADHQTALMQMGQLDSGEFQRMQAMWSNELARDADAKTRQASADAIETRHKENLAQKEEHHLDLVAHRERQVAENAYKSAQTAANNIYNQQTKEWKSAEKGITDLAETYRIISGDVQALSGAAKEGKSQFLGDVDNLTNINQLEQDMSSYMTARGALKARFDKAGTTGGVDNSVWSANVTGRLGTFKNNGVEGEAPGHHQTHDGWPLVGWDDYTAATQAAPGLKANQAAPMPQLKTVPRPPSMNPPTSGQHWTGPPPDAPPDAQTQRGGGGPTPGAPLAMQEVKASKTGKEWNETLLEESPDGAKKRQMTSGDGGILEFVTDAAGQLQVKGTSAKGVDLGVLNLNRKTGEAVDTTGWGPKDYDALLQHLLKQSGEDVSDIIGRDEETS